MSQKAAERWLHWTLLLLALVLCLMRFGYLRADFPNHSPWLLDSAKFTDEGWWASAAVRHFLLGHWEVAGDYNPAVAVPVWPILLTMVFHFTGVSLVAARAVNVFFSIATVVLVFLLVRRYRGGGLAAAFAALLLAASPFAFVFSRLATLDTMIVFEWTLSLWLISYAGSPSLWPLIASVCLIPVMLLTKTTALVLIPAVLWLLWTRSRRAALAVGAMAGAAMGLYVFLVLHSRYAGDYHYFFVINAQANVEWKSTGCYLLQLLQNGLWIDRILYPAALAALVLSLAWLRVLWSNPLFATSWIAFIAQCFFILRRQDDYAPRYFLVMLVPLILIMALTLHELALRSRSLAWLLGAVLAVAVVLNTAQIAGFLTHRQYQFYSAARSIQSMVNTHPDVHRLLLGTSADQLSLMTGIPAINDSYSSQDLGEKATSYQPGWYVGWNDLDQDVLDSLSTWRLVEVANFAVFDRDERNRLKLYRMVPLQETSK
jgi:4-amino-4-deoxy-L-arabinose transferase-like glycosyltransferase